MKKTFFNEDVVECYYNGGVVKIPVELFTEMTMGVHSKPKKFVRYKDGAKMYGMSERNFFDLVRDAEAIYRRGKMVLVNLEILDNFMEYFRE